MLHWNEFIIFHQFLEVGHICKTYQTTTLGSILQMHKTLFYRIREKATLKMKIFTVTFQVKLHTVMQLNATEILIFALG